MLAITPEQLRAYTNGLLLSVFKLCKTETAAKLLVGYPDGRRQIEPGTVYNFSPTTFANLIEEAGFPYAPASEACAAFMSSMQDLMLRGLVKVDGETLWAAIFKYSPIYKLGDSMKDYVQGVEDIADVDLDKKFLNHIQARYPELAATKIHLTNSGASFCRRRIAAAVDRKPLPPPGGNMA